MVSHHSAKAVNAYMASEKEFDDHEILPVS